MKSKNLIQKSVRINELELEKLKKKLGVDDSKAIRAAINCANNVIHNLFGREVGDIFRRKKANEELDFYENP